MNDRHIIWDEKVLCHAQVDCPIRIHSKVVDPEPQYTCVVFLLYKTAQFTNVLNLSCILTKYCAPVTYESHHRISLILLVDQRCIRLIESGDALVRDVIVGFELCPLLSTEVVD